MRFRSWTNIALLLAVAIVATMIFLFRDAGRLEPAPLTELDPAAVTELEVDYADDRPTLRASGGPGGWRLIEPIQRPARDARITRILSFLNVRNDACYAESGERRAEFGLEQPELTLVANGTRVTFGDRSPDGRRYVQAGERLCLVDDVAQPLLAQGVDGLAALAILPQDADPAAIRTPEAEARQAEPDGEWDFTTGEGAGQRWAARWRAATAAGFDLDPPEADLGEVRITFHQGGAETRWRIAARAGDGQNLVLVPEGSDYGLRIAASEAIGLIEPPEEIEDGLN